MKFISLRDEAGIAIVEFVALALPLLIPLAMYLEMTQANSSINSDLSSLARQSARAYVTSPSEVFEDARMQSILQLFEVRVLHPQGIKEIPTIRVECSNTPCLTPDARVKVTISLIHSENGFGGILRFARSSSTNYSATDTQIVDAWR